MRPAWQAIDRSSSNRLVDLDKTREALIWLRNPSPTWRECWIIECKHTEVIPTSFGRKDHEMSNELETMSGRHASLSNIIRHELEHLRSQWIWFLVLGLLLTAAGTAAVVVPPITVGTTFAATIFLGVLLMVGGVAMIVSSFWIGRWSGFLVQLLVGLLYLACGFLITEDPAVSSFAITVFIAVSFVVMGIFRTIAALTLRFPQWGWALLNGVVTLLAGVVIYKQLPNDALWVIGLLVGLEMLFNGWTWIMLAIAIRRIPKESA